MIWAFITVIVMGTCGMGSVFVLASRISGGELGKPPWIEQPVAGPDGTTIIIPLDPDGSYRNNFDWRGPVSAVLAFSAVLLGAATFFSRRVTQPLTKLTNAAQTMAGGDLSVRVGNSSVKEIDDLAGAFNTMAVSLSDADRQRRQMTADVAHELRTPLSIIRGRLEGMQDGIYEATPEQIGILLNEAALLERLIEDLRILALAESGVLPLHMESIEPGALVRSVVKSFAAQASAQKVNLEAVPEAGLPEVVADPQRIAQVLGNLVANSLRHTPGGGSVMLRAWTERRDGKQVVGMSVWDTGSGISAEDLPHIFDRFYRADHSRTRSSGGAGLGLAIAKRMIEAHGGSIWAESKRGEGTVVGFWLPLVQAG